jgi:PKD repeat protein
MRPPIPDKRSFLAVTLLAAAALALSPGPAHAAPSPDASLAADLVSPVAGQAVTLYSTSTAKAAQPIVRYEWDLDGNGTFETDTGAAPQLTHTFTVPGVVVVGLRVTDTKNRIGTAALPITVRWNEEQPPPPPPSPLDTSPPKASFIYSPTSPRPGQAITFASTSSDPGAGGGIAQEAWDVNGDGLFGDFVGRTATAAFTPGAHAVSLRVTDRAGLQSVYTESIEVVSDASSLQLANGRVLRLMSPFPVIRMAGRYYSHGVKVSLLSIAAASTATVRIRCEGRGCGFTARTYRPRSAAASRLLRVRSLERRLRSGTRVVVTVTRSGAIGKYTRFRIRNARPPSRVDRCILPGAGKPMRCPGA